MARFMDFHEDLMLPAEAIAQIVENTRNAKADQFSTVGISAHCVRSGQIPETSVQAERA